MVNAGLFYATGESFKVVYCCLFPGVGEIGNQMQV